MTTKQIPHFNIQQICDSGQCFRMTPVEENKYSVVASGRYLEITQEKENCTFSCGEEEFETFWKNYFDLDRNYEDYLCQINPNDRYLSEAGRFGYGIRILHQDLGVNYICLFDYLFISS